MERQKNALLVEERLWGGKLCLGIRQNALHGEMRVCYGSREKDWRNVVSVAVREAEIASSPGVGIGGGNVMSRAEPAGWRQISMPCFVRRRMLRWTDLL